MSALSEYQSRFVDLIEKHPAILIKIPLGEEKQGKDAAIAAIQKALEDELQIKLSWNQVLRKVAYMRWRLKQKIQKSKVGNVVLLMEWEQKFLALIEDEMVDSLVPITEEEEGEEVEEEGMEVEEEPSSPPTLYYEILQEVSAPSTLVSADGTLMTEEPSLGVPEEMDSEVAKELTEEQRQRYSLLKRVGVLKMQESVACLAKQKLLGEIGRANDAVAAAGGDDD